MIVRTESDAPSLIAAVQRELRAIDPTIAIEHIKTMEQIRSESVASQTFAMRLMTGFSVIGSILAVVGIYGVLSLSVASRGREIAIRMAIGAQRWSILSLVLNQGMRLITAGLLIGVVAALMFSRILAALLFGVAPTDPATFIAVALLCVAIALLAYAPVSAPMQIGDATRYVRAQLVSANFFSALGAAPVSGRIFVQEDDRTPGQTPVAVISDSCCSDSSKPIRQ